MAKRRFIQCDVFTSTPTRGNGLAVVIDAEGMDDPAMQAFAAWTNLAETTFLFPPSDPQADYKVRIYTPTREMLFAGHPTLGSCASWLHTEGKPKANNIVRQECGVGIVDIHLDGKMPAFVAPPTKISPMEPKTKAAISAALELGPSSIVRTANLENGPVWQVIELKSAADVLAVDSSKVRWPEFKAIGLIGAHPEGSPADYEVRMLAPSSGMSEDPITGSLNAALARWMAAEGRLEKDIIVSQGRNIGRDGKVHITRQPGHPDNVMIGGDTIIMIEGTLEI